MNFLKNLKAIRENNKYRNKVYLHDKSILTNFSEQVLELFTKNNITKGEVLVIIAGFYESIEITKLLFLKVL